MKPVSEPTKKGSMKDKYVYHELNTSVGGGEICELTLVTDMESGESFIKLRMSYSKRYKTNELDLAKSDMEALTGSGYINDIERLVKMRNIDAGLEHLREDSV